MVLKYTLVVLLLFVVSLTANTIKEDNTEKRGIHSLFTFRLHSNETQNLVLLLVSREVAKSV